MMTTPSAWLFASSRLWGGAYSRPLARASICPTGRSCAWMTSGASFELLSLVVLTDLPCVLRCARLAHDGDFNLPGVVQRFLDGLADVPRQPHGFHVVDGFRLDDDAHLAASLDSE